MADPQFVQYETKLEGAPDEDYRPWPEPGYDLPEGETWDSDYWGQVNDGVDYAAQVGIGTDLTGFVPGGRITVRARGYTPGAPFGAWSAPQSQTVGATINVTLQPAGWSGAVGQTNSFTADHDGTSQQWVQIDKNVEQIEDNITEIAGETAKTYNFTASAGDIGDYQVALRCEIGAAYIYTQFVDRIVSSNAMSAHAEIIHTQPDEEIVEVATGTGAITGMTARTVPDDAAFFHARAADEFAPYRARISGGQFYKDTADGYRPMLRIFPAVNQLCTDAIANDPVWETSAGINKTPQASTLVAGEQEYVCDGGTAILQRFSPRSNNDVEGNGVLNVMVFVAKQGTSPTHGFGINTATSGFSRGNFTFSNGNFSWHGSSVHEDFGYRQIGDSFFIAVAQTVTGLCRPYHYPCGYNVTGADTVIIQAAQHYQGLTIDEALEQTIATTSGTVAADAVQTDIANLPADDAAILFEFRIPLGDLTTACTLIEWSANERLWVENGELRLLWNGNTLACTGVAEGINQAAFNYDAADSRYTLRCNGAVNTATGFTGLSLGSEIKYGPNVPHILDIAEIDVQAGGSYTDRQNYINTVLGEPTGGPPPGADPNEWRIHVNGVWHGRGGSATSNPYLQKHVDALSHECYRVASLQRLSLHNTYPGFAEPMGKVFLDNVTTCKILMYYKLLLTKCEYSGGTQDCALPILSYTLRDGERRYSDADTNPYGAWGNKPNRYLEVFDSNGNPARVGGGYGADVTNGNRHINPALSPPQGEPKGSEYSIASYKADNTDRTVSGFSLDQLCDGIWHDVGNCYYPSSGFTTTGTIPQYPTSESWTDARVQYFNELIAGIGPDRPFYMNSGLTDYSKPEQAYAINAINASAVTGIMQEGGFVYKFGVGDVFIDGLNNTKNKLDCMTACTNIDYHVWNLLPALAGRSYTENGTHTVGTSGDVMTTKEIYEYALCAFLLGRHAHHNFGIRFRDSPADQTADYDINDHSDKCWQVVTGAPLDGWSQQSLGGQNILFRNYEHVWVYLNPNNANTTSFNLPGPGRRISNDDWDENRNYNGLPQVSSISLNRYRGAIIDKDATRP